MSVNTSDTICALSTAAGEGGIAIVRVSGDGARALFPLIFRPAGAPGFESHVMRYGYAVDAEGNELDEVMGVFFAAPRTYTREDVFELHCHGGGVSAARILSRLIGLGARPAESGEFTRRAFLNGRIDLSRAEAVMALIGANSEAAARASLRQLKGGVSVFVRGVCEELKDRLSLIEACTDFPDEVEEEETARIVRESAVRLAKELREKCDPRAARILREGASIVLAGRPNVGKSSLMNALLCRDRAIVTQIPGTTRDVLTERLRLGGITAELTDTAGLRETGDEVERIGVERARDAADSADIVLLVLDSARELTDEERDMLAARDERTIVCLNKCDLPRVTDVPGAMPISCRTGEGIPELMAALTERLGRADQMDDMLTGERHLALARAAAEALDNAVSSIDMGFEPDVCAIDLRDALDALCRITGENATEEVIDRVFSSFCVGK